MLLVHEVYSRLDLVLTLTRVLMREYVYHRSITRHGASIGRFSAPKRYNRRPKMVTIVSQLVWWSDD
jgi:hypothetical protein